MGLDRQAPEEKQACRGQTWEAGSACGVDTGQEIVLRPSFCPQPSLGRDGQAPRPEVVASLKGQCEEPEVSRGRWQGRERGGTCLKKDVVAKCLGDPPSLGAVHVIGTSAHGPVTFLSSSQPGKGRDAGRVYRSWPGDLQCGHSGAALPNRAFCSEENIL